MNNLYYLIGIVIFMILCLNKKHQVSSYVNYDKLHENPLLNCPEQYEIGMGELGKRFQTIQPFGYTKHETFDMTRFTDATAQSLDFNNLKFGKPTEKYVPLPVDPDFFM